VDKDYSITAVVKNYPSTDKVVAQTPMQSKVPNDMLHMSKDLPVEAKGTELRVPDSELGVYLLKPEVDHLRCPAGSFTSGPTCSGSGCLPCFYGHLSKLHPEDESMASIERIISRWRGILAPFLAVHAHRAEDPFHQGPHNLDQDAPIPEGVIRTFWAR